MRSRASCKGAVHQLWHRAEAPGVCILWETESADEVLGMVKMLPFARAGIIESSLIALKPYIDFGLG